MENEHDGNATNNKGVTGKQKYGGLWKGKLRRLVRWQREN